MAAKNSSRSVVYAALAGNLLVTLTKFVAAWWTGSSVMLSEAIHSLVDTSDQLLLLYGMHRAELPPDAMHPLGHGRELYFWSFIVALLMFTMGAGATFFEGVHHILNPSDVVDRNVSYVVLACAALFEGTTWFIALRRFRQAKGDANYFEAVRRSKDPPAFIVLFEDSAALLGLLIAFAGTFLSAHLSVPQLDGVASIGISMVLALTALVLARESKGLLIGELASPVLRDAILDIARATPGIEHAQIAFTVHLAPNQVLAALALEFRDNLTAPEIEKIIDDLQHAIHEAHPEVIAIFATPEASVTQPILPGRLPSRARKLSALTGKSAAPSAR